MLDVTESARRPELGLRRALRQSAFAFALPQRLPAGVSVRLILFIRSAKTQVSTAHRRAIGVNTQTDTPLYHYLAMYGRNKTERCREEKRLSQKHGTGNHKQIRLQDYTPPQAVNNASPEVCIAYVHIVIMVTHSFLFLISI